MADEVFDLLGDPISEPREGAGRPEHVATDRNRNKIILLLAMGWTLARIAPAIGITTKTLRKHYSLQLKAREIALDRVKAGHASLLWDQAAQGNVAALKEIGKMIAGIDAARFGMRADAPDDDDEPAPRPQRLGKKEEATIAARSAGAGSGWGSDLLPPPSKMN